MQPTFRNPVMDHRDIDNCISISNLSFPSKLSKNCSSTEVAISGKVCPSAAETAIWLLASGGPMNWNGFLVTALRLLWRHRLRTCDAARCSRHECDVRQWGWDHEIPETRSSTSYGLMSPSMEWLWLFLYMVTISSDSSDWSHDIFCVTWSGLRTWATPLHSIHSWCDPSHRNLYSVSINTLMTFISTLLPAIGFSRLSYVNAEYHNGGTNVDVIKSTQTQSG